MSHPNKQQLLEEFSGFLDQTITEQPDLAQQPDLQSLLTEMAGLKMEVKTESRHIKSMLDQFSQSMQLISQDNQTLTAQLNREIEKQAQLQQNIEKDLLLQFLEVYDRIVAGSELLDKYQPVDALFNHSKKQDLRFIGSLKQGQEMSIRRMEQLFLTYKVRPIVTLGRSLDPETMIAVATVENKKIPAGQVVEEIRRGFYYHDSILRPAEVKVNKLAS